MIKTALLICMLKCSFTAFEYRETPPASLFPFIQAAADSTLPDSVSNPAYLPRFRYPYLHCSGSMPYTLSDLYATTLRLGYGTRGCAVQAVWNRFGFEQYLENIVDLNFAYMPIRYISIGAGARYYNLTINSIEASLATHLVDGRASIIIAPFEWIELGFIQENIASLFIKKRRDILFPEWSAGATIRPFRGITLVYNITKTAAGYVNCVSANANILKYFTVSLGYAREASTASASLTFLYRYIAVSYGLKYHPHLGFTHSVGVTLSPSEMNINPLCYGDIFKRDRKTDEPRKAEINACSFEELLGLPGIDDRYAGRIMEHRKTIGPLSRKSLLQIGMTEPEIDRLLEHITGLRDDGQAPKTDRNARERRERYQKGLFNKLIGLGLPASTSLMISDMAVQGDRRQIIERIKTLPGLDDQTRKKAVELCGARD